MHSLQAQSRTAVRVPQSVLESGAAEQAICAAAVTVLVQDRPAASAGQQAIRPPSARHAPSRSAAGPGPDHAVPRRHIAACRAGSGEYFCLLGSTPAQPGVLENVASCFSCFGLADTQLNVRPTKPGARARSDRVLAKLWEAQMFVSSSSTECRRTDHGALANALVSATWSLGAVKRAFATTKPTAEHDEMIRCSRQFAADAAAVIERVMRGTTLNDPETVCILFELFLMRDVSPPAV